MKLLRSVQLTQELRAAAQFLTEALQQCAARSEASKQQRGLAMEDELEELTWLASYTDREGTRVCASVTEEALLLYPAASPSAAPVSASGSAHALLRVALRASQCTLLSPDDGAALFKVTEVIAGGAEERKHYFLCASDAAAVAWVARLTAAMRDAQQHPELTESQRGVSALLSAKRVSSAMLLEEHELELLQFLGAGAFGKVYRGNVRGSPAAIKVLHQQTMDEDVMEEFVNEVQLMSAVHHRNVIACMGYALQPLAIVTELMHTSLEALFFPPPEASALSLTTKLRLLQDAALGVHWLHSLNPMIVHRDIKPPNFLVDAHMRTVVADFGLSDALRKGGSTWDKKGAMKGTVLYTAPEILRGLEFNEKSDVYSFGLVIWTATSAAHPYTELRALSHQDFVNAICFEQHRPAVASTVPASLAALMARCWAADAHARPSALEIAQSLNAIVEELVMHDAGAYAFWNTHFKALNAVRWRSFAKAFAASYSGEDECGADEETLKMLSMLLCFTASNDDALVTFERFGHVLDCFGPWSVLLSNVRAAVRAPWFFGDLSLRRVRVALADMPPGTFLVRVLASQRSVFALDYRTAHGTVAQRLIAHEVEATPHGVRARYVLRGSEGAFASLADAVAAVREATQPCPESPFKHFRVALPELDDKKTFVL